MFGVNTALTILYQRPIMILRSIIILGLSLLSCSVSSAQETQTEEAQKRARLLETLPDNAAKRLFGGVSGAAPLEARAIGSFAKGCLAGAKALPVDGESWQVMRLSRNRNWGHPELIALLERLARKAPAVTGWQGILVGDISQPRGGPMLTGHASHQIGLDADIWLTPKPATPLSPPAARGDERRQHGAGRLDGHRKGALDARAARHDPPCRAGAEGDTHFREPGDQGSPLPRCRSQPRLARKGAADVGP